MRAEGWDDAVAGNEQRESVLWCEQERRCELWVIKGSRYLRLFDGETLITEEPLLQGALWAQALALRTWRPARRQRHQFGFRESS